MIGGFGGCPVASGLGNACRGRRRQSGGERLLEVRDGLVVRICRKRLLHLLQ